MARLLEPRDRRARRRGALLLAAAGTRLRRIGLRIPWPVTALAAVGLAVVAIIFQPWPARYSKADAGLPADRGSTRAAIEPTVGKERVSWSPVAGADEQRVELYDDAGLPVGAPAAATSPFVLPVEARGGWIRIEALHERQPLARSALTRLPGSPRAGIVPSP